MFAYYCTPGILKGDASLDKNLPVVVCVHGGGGRAFSEWVKLWAKKGYAAIAMDWSGNGPEPMYPNPTEQERKKLRHKIGARKHLPNGGQLHIPENVSLIDGKNERDVWVYHAVGAIVRAHSLVRSFREIDQERTAITGISWGGFLTSLVSGIDYRFKVAVPVYGCGFVYEMPEIWGEYTGAGDKSQKRWIEIFDPSKSLEVTKIPMLFVNSPTDMWYPLQIWTKSVELARAKTLLDAKLKHGHSHGWRTPEIELFISSIFNKVSYLPSVGKLEIDNQIASCKFDGKLKTAKLYFTKTNDKKLWKDFVWESVDAKISSDKIIAEIPQGARAVYISVTSQKDVRVTTNAVIFK